jgi:WD40 repeat protein
MAALVWSPDASQIASGSARWFPESPVTFDVWQIDDGAHVQRFDEVEWEEIIGWHNGIPRVVSREVGAPNATSLVLAVSADGTRIAQWRRETDDEYTQWFEILDADGNLIWSLRNFMQAWHASADFSLDGHYLAVSSASDDVAILDAQTGEIIAQLPLIPSNAVAFSPDGTQLAVAEGYAIQIYTVEALMGT